MSSVAGALPLPRFSAESWDRMLGTNLSACPPRLPALPHAYKVGQFRIHWPIVATCDACGAQYRTDISPASAKAHADEFGHKKFHARMMMPWAVPPERRLVLLGPSSIPGSN